MNLQQQADTTHAALRADRLQQWMERLLCLIDEGHWANSEAAEAARVGLLAWDDLMTQLTRFCLLLEDQLETLPPEQLQVGPGLELYSEWLHRGEVLQGRLRARGRRRPWRRWSRGEQRSTQAAVLAWMETHLRWRAQMLEWTEALRERR